MADEFAKHLDFCCALLDVEESIDAEPVEATFEVGEAEDEDDREPDAPSMG
jgi:hypothetical protein